MNKRVAVINHNIHPPECIPKAIFNVFVPPCTRLTDVSGSQVKRRTIPVSSSGLMLGARETPREIFDLNDAFDDCCDYSTCRAEPQSFRYVVPQMEK